MKNQSYLSLALLFIFLIFQPSAVSSQTQLDNYIKEALENNLDLKKQDFALQKSLYALKEAKSLFLPEVEFNTSYITSGGGRKIEIPIGDLLNPVYNSLNNLTGSGKFPQVENVSQTFNPNNYYDTRAHTSIPIFNAEIIYNSRIKKEQITYQQVELKLYKRELVKQVKLAYFNYIQSLQAIKVFQNAVELAKENLRINQAMVSNGKAIRTVVSRSENELTGISAQLQEAETQAQNAAAYFNFLLNRPLQTAVREEMVTSSVSTDTVNPQKREELLALESLGQVNELAVKLSKSSALPKLTTFLDLGLQGDFLKVNRDAPYYLFGVNLSIPVFTGNRNKHKTRQAQIELNATQTQLEQAEKQLNLEVLSTRNRLTAAKSSYEAAVSQVALSEKYYKDEQRLYKEGQALYLELLDAQTRLINDQLKQSMALLNVRTRETELERARASYVL
ncbi:TolC family protein [Pedobacter antarcticus]|uniref:TolC family protein n=1 Tax=Pedobacter antarcticus TaxID=34086 RepID=UPI001C58B12A|nr:TolC family protein [Pedobacter antarcticus]